MAMPRKYASLADQKRHGVFFTADDEMLEMLETIGQSLNISRSKAAALCVSVAMDRPMSEFTRKDYVRTMTRRAER